MRSGPHGRSGNLIVAIKQARSFFPFPLLSVDFDNDSAFINEFVVSWCRSEELEVTRSRAYRKNDQAARRRRRAW